jgi:hypothetical protein
LGEPNRLGVQAAQPIGYLIVTRCLLLESLEPTEDLVGHGAFTDLTRLSHVDWQGGLRWPHSSKTVRLLRGRVVDGLATSITPDDGAESGPALIDQ